LSVGSDSGQQHSNWWWCHDTGSPRLAAEHLLCMVPWSELLAWRPPHTEGLCPF